jgi:DNA-binding MarR family transcriptional regulator
LSSQILIPQRSATVEAFVALVRASAAATRDLSGQLVREHGLTINDYEALLTLSRAEGGMMRRVDLSRALLLTPSGVTRLLEGLECSGLVEKKTCASDARVTYAALTASGRVKLKQASHSHVAQIQALFSKHYSAEEATTLGDLLKRLGTGETEAACELE